MIFILFCIRIGGVSPLFFSKIAFERLQGGKGDSYAQHWVYPVKCSGCTGMQDMFITGTRMRIQVKDTTILGTGLRKHSFHRQNASDSSDVIRPHDL